MSLLYSSAPGRGRRRRAASFEPGPVQPQPQPQPAPAESVLQYVDPPIYQSLLRHWASKGRTLPGRRDQEWVRIVAAPVWPSHIPARDELSAFPDPPGAAR